MRDERYPTGRDEERAADRAEAASVSLVVQGFIKAARGFLIYLPNNPLHEKFFQDVRARLEEHLAKYGVLELAVEHDTMRCCGETVYTNTELRENLAFRMYADGIRTLRFVEGIEPRELRAVVGAIGRPAAEDAQDDIVTQLWAEDLPHVSYELAEIPPVADASALGAASAAPQEAAIRRFAAQPAAPSPAPPPVFATQQIFTLTEEELRGLQQLVLDEERHQPIEDVSEVLAAVLAVEPDAVLFREFLDILVRLCGDLLLTGRPGQAVLLLRVLERVSVAPGLPPGNAAAIAEARGRVVTDEVRDGLAKTLAAPEGVGREELRDLVAALGPPAMGQFCQLLGDVPGKETRKVLIDALAEVGRGTPELLLPYLEDPRWYLVRNTIYILRRIADPKATAAVRRCAGHRDPRVRKEALLFFDEVSDPAAESVLLRLLEDETAALRIAAGRSLARRRSQAGAERLLALAASAGFAARDLEERQAVYEALAELAPARMLPVFQEMLRRRRWFGAAKETEEAACAVAGLRRMGSPEAVALLREAAGSRKERVRTLAEEALRGLARRGPKGEPRA